MTPELAHTASDLTDRSENTRWLPAGSDDAAAALTLRFVDAWARWLEQEPGPSDGQSLLIPTSHGEAHVIRFVGHGKIPILLIHGWPTSFLAFHRAIGPVRQMASEVVLAILPGFGTAPAPKDGMAIAAIAGVLADAMMLLGHSRFIVHGQDWGSVVARQIAVSFPDRVVGVHVSAGLQGFMADGPACGDSWRRLGAFADKGRGYLHFQSHRPDFLAVGLGDSPAGLLAWQLDKYQLWQASLGPDFGLGEDFILANATFYWAAGSIGSSMRIYSENRDVPAAPPSAVPTAVSVFGTGDFACREVSMRENNLIAWYEHADGGHVAALDATDSFISDLSDFVNRMETVA